MTREEAEKYLIDISYQIGTMGIEYLTEKDGEKMREAIEALEQEPKTEKVVKMRDATPEERESVNKYIKSISKPTGVDFWDLEQEPKTGHWIFDEILDKHYYCSECKSMGVDYWDYCPNCGARMVSE